MPHVAFETAVLEKYPTIKHIAGIDEAGRGALAGPVVAAAAILPLDTPETVALLSEINDSKKLSAKKRDTFFDLIQEHATCTGVGIVDPKIIDDIGIAPATRLAMQTAVSQLAPAAQFLLVDGRMKLQEIALPQQAIIRGDSQSLSIAAASIIAKVTRDRLMAELSATYPLYNFAQHKGYGTQFHRDAIGTHGPCQIHRFTFAPIRQD